MFIDILCNLWAASARKCGCRHNIYTYVCMYVYVYAYTYIYVFCIDVDARRGGCKHGCYKYIRMYMCVYTCMYMYTYIYSNMDMSILYNPCAVGARQVVSVPLLSAARVSLRRCRWKPFKSRAVHSKKNRNPETVILSFFGVQCGRAKNAVTFYQGILQQNNHVCI